jgi:hypothetical protein
MKTKMVLLGLFMASTTVLSAQKSGRLKERLEEIKAERKEFINKYVGLSGAEADKFWKVEDEMHAKLQEIRKAMRQEMKAIKDKGIDNATDAELKRAMDNRMNYEQKLLDIRKEYHIRFVDLLGVKKTAKFYEGEREFKKNLLKKLRESGRDTAPGDEDED